MQVVRVLALVLLATGAVSTIAMGPRATEAEVRLCSLARPFVTLPDACFQGAPAWLPYVLATSLIVVGIAGLLWTRTWSLGAARLSVKGPRLHQYPPNRAQTTSFCRMRILNRGPADAKDVQIRLLGIEPRPRHSSWRADYPYPVARVGQPIDASTCEIARGADEIFQVASGWRDVRGEFMAGLDTKSGFHNPTPIAPDERWELTYEVTAGNARPVRFLLEMSVQGSGVAVKRKS